MPVRMSVYESDMSDKANVLRNHLQFVLRTSPGSVERKIDKWEGDVRRWISSAGWEVLLVQTISLSGERGEVKIYVRYLREVR